MIELSLILSNEFIKLSCVEPKKLEHRPLKTDFRHNTKLLEITLKVPGKYHFINDLKVPQILR